MGPPECRFLTHVTVLPVFIIFAAWDFAFWAFLHTFLGGDLERSWLGFSASPPLARERHRHGASGIHLRRGGASFSCVVAREKRWPALGAEGRAGEDVVLSPVPGHRHGRDHHRAPGSSLRRKEDGKTLTVTKL